MKSFSLVLLSLGLFALAGCPAPPPPDYPEQTQPVADPADPPTDSPDQPDLPADPPVETTATGCNTNADCGDGVCEGMGCGPNMGVCAAKSRRCTRDRRAYCGCDGKTFYGSGSCPGARFSQQGPCKGDRPDGSSCSTAGDCASGVCEGQGCGGNTGTCMARDRKCTLDLRDYCGCDGKSFQASGSCPGRVYASRGACK